MSISGISSSLSVYGIQSTDLFSTDNEQTTQQQQAKNSGDTVSISAEARLYFAQMQSMSTATESQEEESAVKASVVSAENAEASVTLTEQVGESQSATPDSQGGSGGGAGGGSGGGSSEEDTSSTEETIESEIASVMAQISQAQSLAKESGDSSQVNALMGQLASLQAELSALSS